MKYKLIIMLLAFASLVACTSTQTLESEQATLEARLETGDHLIIREKSGRTVDMVLKSIEDDELRGVLSDDPATAVSVNMSDVEKIEKETVDGFKTVAAAAGGAGLLYILLATVVFLTW